MQFGLSLAEVALKRSFKRSFKILANERPNCMQELQEKLQVCGLPSNFQDENCEKKPQVEADDKVYGPKKSAHRKLIKQSF